MKQLMLGNAAIARGLYEAGCTFISSYPGTPSTEITEEAAAYPELYCEWAPNEKVAMETAFGASLAGYRTACAMKHVGLNVAADPLFTLGYTGVNGGMVIFVADDPGMHSSQNEQDSRHYAAAAKIPMLEPADSAEALAFTKAAFAISEEYDTPVLVRMCTRISHSQSVVETAERTEHTPLPYTKNIAKYVMMPGFAKRRHPIVEARTRKLVELGETTPLNHIVWGDTSLGILTSGTCYQYAREVFGDKASILKLGLVNPLPQALIRDFAAKVDRLVVIEELDGVLEDHCRKLGLAVSGKDLFPLEDEFSQNLLTTRMGGAVTAGPAVSDEIPNRPPVMCAGCPHRGIFYTLMKNKLTVLGDIGCYTLGSMAPLAAMDTTICMGSSISSLHGFNKAQGDASAHNAVAVIGDSTFLHTGINSLVNVAYNQSNSTVLILDNSITGMTGQQQNPATGLNLRGEPAGRIDLEALCRAMGFDRVRVVDPYDLAACDAAVKEELAAAAPSVIISRRPCALLKTVVHKPPLRVDADKCVGCTACMKLGCPALHMEGKQAAVDRTLCVGCDVCTQLCHFDALCKEKEAAQ